MEFKVRIEDEDIKLTELDNKYFIDKIPLWFDTWDMDRSTQRDQYEKVHEAISLNITKNKDDADNIMLPNIYEQYQTYKANIWRSSLGNLDNMFDVAGRTYDDQLNASKQKVMLVNTFREMNLLAELDRASDDWILIGEMILFVGWETKVRYRRKKEQVPNELTGALESSFAIKEDIIYDGAKVTHIDPFLFTFDKSKKTTWDACPKIYRKWMTLEELEENKAYELSASDKGVLRALVDEEESLLKKQGFDYNILKNKAHNGDLVEILELWGDVRLPNGKLMKNFVLTIAGRTAIVRVGANPFIINPFVYANYIEDKDTRRGVSPLAPTIVLNQVSSSILSLQLQALKLELEKPMLAPKGMFSGRQKIREGAILEYNINPHQPTIMPQPLQFSNALMGMEFLNYFETAIEKTTGIFKYMTGSQDDRFRTATETSKLVEAQSIRLSKEIAMMNLYIIVPTVEAIAGLIANMKFGDEQVMVKSHDGNVDFESITDEVRQGNYKYNYGDNQTLSEAKGQIREVTEALSVFQNIPEFATALDWSKLIHFVFSRYNIPNSESFIKSDMIDIALKEYGVPLELHEEVKARLAENMQIVLDQMIAEKEQEKQSEQSMAGGSPQMGATAGSAEQVY